MTFILASSSPRRAELLRQIGLDFCVAQKKFAEIEDSDMDPAALVIANARGKAEAARGEGDAVLAADTIVLLGKKVLGKPTSPADAERMLISLSGRKHAVLTGLCLIYKGEVYSAVEKTEVFMRELSEREIKAYVATGEPLDKAGGYGVQGLGALLVESIRGCYFNVVGLPLARLLKLLQKAGITFEYKKSAAR